MPDGEARQRAIFAERIRGLSSLLMLIMLLYLLFLVLFTRIMDHTHQHRVVSELSSCSSQFSPIVDLVARGDLKNGTV